MPGSPLGAHPPLLPGMPTIEGSYRTVVDSLPGGLRDAAHRLPWRLGLTPSPDGGWGDFVGLHPNRDLPLYAAEAPGGGLALEETVLASYLRAHHLGGFSWLLRDRLADGQVAPDPRLEELAEVLDRRWRAALVTAMNDEAAAESLCARATARWRRGTHAEQLLLGDTSSSVSAPLYAAVVKEKLSWIAVPSQALLRVRGEPRGAAFRRAHELYLLGLQVIDDVIDMKQDSALHARHVPGALGCSPGALIRVAPKLLRRAAAVARAGGFVWFATWLEAFAKATGAWRLDGDIRFDELDAIGIAGEIEEAVLKGGGGVVRLPVTAGAAPAPA